MIRKLLLVLMAVTATACAGYLPRYEALPPASPTGFYSDPQSPDLAVLEYRIAKYLDWRDAPTSAFCAGRRDAESGRFVSLPEEIDTRLSHRFPGITPLRECVDGDGNPVATVALFHADAQDCPTDSECAVLAGYRLGAGGYQSRYLARWNGDVWQLAYAPERIILTGLEAVPDASSQSQRSTVGM